MPTGMYVNVSLLDLSRMVPGVGPTLACCEPPVSVTNTDKAASCQHDLCEQPRNPDSEKHLTRATTLDYSNYRDAMSRVHVDVSHEVEKATANENAETNRQPKKRSEASMRVGELLKKNKAARLAKLAHETPKEAEGSVNAALVEDTPQPEPFDMKTPHEIPQQEPVELKMPDQVPQPEPLDLVPDKTPEPEPIESKTPDDIPSQEPLQSKEFEKNPAQEPEPKKPEPVKDTADTTVMPKLPSDWGSVEYVSSDQQQPPKKRGRKPKQPADVPCKSTTEETPAEDLGGKRKLNEAVKAKTKRTRTAKPEKSEAPVPEAPKKCRKSKKAAAATSSSTAEPPQTTASDALEMMPVPKRQRSTAKAIQQKNHKPTEYVANEVTEECNSFDAYAVASTAVDVAHMSAAATTTVAAAEPAGAPSIADSVTTATRDAETKKKLSRKSCAYKKARGLALKEGKSKEEAAVIARKAT